MKDYIIDTMEKLKTFCKDYKSEYYILSYFDNKTDRPISYEVVHNPIDIIRNLSKFLEVIKLPLNDVDIYVHGIIKEGNIYPMPDKPFKLEPKLYYTDLNKKEENIKETKKD